MLELSVIQGAMAQSLILTIHLVIDHTIIGDDSKSSAAESGCTGEQWPQTVAVPLLA